MLDAVGLSGRLDDFRDTLVAHSRRLKKVIWASAPLKRPGMVPRRAHIGVIRSG